MTKNLKLIKNEKKQRWEEVESPIEPALTPAEFSEAARFKARTTIKASRRAKVHRLMDELKKRDELVSAA